MVHSITLISFTTIHKYFSFIKSCMLSLMSFTIHKCTFYLVKRCMLSLISFTTIHKYFIFSKTVHAIRKHLGASVCPRFEQ
jgi:hypothetical protein